MNLKYIAGVILILVSRLHSYGQTLPGLLYLDKAAIKNYGIDTIKDFSGKEGTKDRGSYVVYVFEKGLIVKQAFFDSIYYQNISEALANGTSYDYDTKGNLLSEDGDGGFQGAGAHQSSFVHYLYLNDLVKLATAGLNYWNNVMSGAIQHRSPNISMAKIVISLMRSLIRLIITN